MIQRRSAVSGLELHPSLWVSRGKTFIAPSPWAVCTGGAPALQPAEPALSGVEGMPALLGSALLVRAPF